MTKAEVMTLPSQWTDVLDQDSRLSRTWLGWNSEIRLRVTSICAFRFNRENHEVFQTKFQVTFNSSFFIFKVDLNRVSNNRNEQRTYSKYWRIIQINAAGISSSIWLSGNSYVHVSSQIDMWNNSSYFCPVNRFKLKNICVINTV